MYSPLQEVPSTPALFSRVHTLKRFADTPEAVVPEILFDQSQGESFSVPGTPVPSAVQLSPWTPNTRSLTRTNKGRRYTYNPSLTPRFVPKSPAGAASPREQVVPSTPVGVYLLFNTPGTNRQRFRSTEILTPRIENSVDVIDAAGDRARKRIKKEEKIVNNNKISNQRPRIQREVVARFRRSPEAARGKPGDADVSHDFLDLI